MSLLDIKNLSFAYTSHNVLENVNFEVQDGDFWAIIGPNGGGKSTLVRLILGLLKAQSGSISFAQGMELTQIGYVPQNTNFNMNFPICVRDVITLGLLKPSILGFRVRKHLKVVQDAIEQLHIAHLAQKPINALSGGERQKVLIARALVNRTRLLILDEPTASVDVKAQGEIYELLLKLNKHISIIVVSHDISFILGYAKKVLYVNKYALTHNIPQCDLDLKGHICEVDILNSFAQKVQNLSEDSQLNVSLAPQTNAKEAANG